MKMKAWSYSSIKKYNTCPRQYYHLKVLKDFEEPKTEALDYGKEFHSACELYVRDDTPLPPQFSYVKGTLDKIKALAGTKYCEYAMGLTENLDPCGFFDSNVWWRGIADILVVNGNKAKCGDYKTGKSAKYADTDQLELLALAIFKHFPEVTEVKGALIFVVANKLVKATYTIEKEGKLWEKWLSEYERMKASYKNDVWNPRPSGLCMRHCAVLSCPHNGRN